MEILDDLMAQLESAEHPLFGASALQAALLARLAAQMGAEAVSVGTIAEIAVFATRAGRRDGNLHGIAEFAS